MVKSPRTLAEFTMITLWEIDGFGEISHTVKTLVQDNDYDWSPTMSFWHMHTIRRRRDWGTVFIHPMTV
uniref:hypothetical protein n=1 Tax=Escherichia coli TaxID=562 RepID=UPI0020362A32|nr:hypothetical protein [Escherichia coli]